MASICIFPPIMQMVILPVPSGVVTFCFHQTQNPTRIENMDNKVIQLRLVLNIGSIGLFPLSILPFRDIFQRIENFGCKLFSLFQLKWLHFLRAKFHLRHILSIFKAFFSRRYLSFSFDFQLSPRCNLGDRGWIDKLAGEGMTFNYAISLI